MRVANRYVCSHLRPRLIDLWAGYFWGRMIFFRLFLVCDAPLGAEKCAPGATIFRRWVPDRGHSLKISPLAALRGARNARRGAPHPGAKTGVPGGAGENIFGSGQNFFGRRHRGLRVFGGVGGAFCGGGIWRERGAALPLVLLALGREEAVSRLEG